MKNKQRIYKGALSGALVLLLLMGLTSCASSDTASVVTDETQRKLAAIQSLIDENYLNESEADDLQDGILSGYVAGLGDPYSVYYDEAETQDLMESTSGEFNGIGVVLSQDNRTGIITMLKIYEDSPAMEAGLKDGDILYKVGDMDVSGMDLSEVVTYIKGEKGTGVDLTVYRGEQYDEVTVHVIRDTIQAQTVQTRMLTDSIGYLALSEFDAVSVSQYEEGLADLTAQGMEGLIVDLRNNPGGSLAVVCELLNDMLPEGLVVYTENKNGERKEYNSEAEQAFDGPLAVLVNGNSASASEIYAGAIQDYGAGQIVGTQTYGKGVVQQLFDLGDGTCVKLTISQYYTPNGRSIDGVGITPDVEVAYESDPDDTEADNQLDQALAVIQEEMGD